MFGFHSQRRQHTRQTLRSFWVVTSTSRPLKRSTLQRICSSHNRSSDRFHRWQVHYIVSPSVDLRWVRCAEGCHRLRLSFLASSNYGASVQCWMAAPTLQLPVLSCTSDSNLLLRSDVRDWLRESAKRCDEQTGHLIHGLACGRVDAPSVVVHCRRLRASFGDTGVLLQQSDLSLASRLWRSVAIKSCSTLSCHRTALELQERSIQPIGPLVSCEKDAAYRHTALTIKSSLLPH